VGGDFFFKKCILCGFVFLDPKPTFSQLKKHYPPSIYYSYTTRSKTGFFGRLRNYLVLHTNTPSLASKILSFFIKVPAIPTNRKTGRLMDIGCGIGYTLTLLKCIGWDVYGIDIDKKAIEIAKKQGLCHVSLGTFRAVKKYPDNYFDVIRLYHVIEHLDNPEECVKLCYQKLKKGGELIIGTPNIESCIAKIGKQYWYNLDSPRHLFLFSPSTLQKLLQKNNFQIRQTEFSSGGGILGTIQYIVNEKFGRSFDLVNTVWLVILVYPSEWILDRLGLGDVFTVYSIK